jgi:hypothetical protein
MYYNLAKNMWLMNRLTLEQLQQLVTLGRLTQAQADEIAALPRLTEAEIAQLAGGMQE